ncbi:MAG: ATPase [Sulfurimonas sp.]|uniref:ATPase n=1 Tax=Sulfurimonas sp. TaxID=2022749 RepID=UPI0025DD9415|nr:ATPase [Sulfurimonas sp.]MCK9491757.1 ATPase [Sulfurimonas sp.]
MIERFYLRDYLSFKEIELNTTKGLVVFTGPSGSGKSILMKSILSSFGVESCDASLCESSVNWQLEMDDIGIENEEINIFKQLKKEKARYFINNQSLSKKAIADLSFGYLRHLSLKDYSDFEDANLLSILDLRVEKSSKDIKSLKKSYRDSFLKHAQVRTELDLIEEEEKRIVELKEFASFEINKIQEIDPKPSEDEKLLEIKKDLSKKEKLQESIEKANTIFESENFVSSTLNLLDNNSSFFDDAMNELRAIFDSAEARFNELDDVDIEEVLNRIEEISWLKKRYGSIEEALEYREQKALELQRYENIEINKEELTKQEMSLKKEILTLADKISKLRESQIGAFERDLNRYLKELYLRDAQINISRCTLNPNGQDKIEIKLNSTDLQKVSTGEFNRLRLAILALKSEFMNKNGGVLMLDEIDANLSGEESMSVAKVLRQLSKHFQIFVISHQPQLTSMGEQHFLIYKQGDESKVKELNFNERVDEIARIISGESVSVEAKNFAKELLEVSRCAL